MALYNVRNFYFITYIYFSFKAVIFAIYAFMIFCVYMKLKKTC